LRFLVGYHFGYLNYPKQAVRELNKAVELEGRDPAARRLHDIFAVKIGAPTVGPAPGAKTQGSQSDATGATSESRATQSDSPQNGGIRQKPNSPKVGTES
jgi:hypothetical protein